MNPKTSTPESPPRSKPGTWQPPIPWLACVILFSCAAMSTLYWLQTRLPDNVVIAAGPADGRYDQLANALASELQNRLGITVSTCRTHGSLENLQLLESNEVALGLYQSETRAILGQGDVPEAKVRFVANLYPEYLFPIVAASDSLDLTRLQNKVVSCNDHMSGDHAMLTLLLEHVGHSNSSDYATIPYIKLPQALQAGEVDLAVISCGLEAPVLEHVLEVNRAKLADIPFLTSFISKNVALTRRVIPAGYFAMQPVPLPPQDFHTVTTEAQLLASEQAPVRVVEAVTEIVMDPRFQRRLKLIDLAMHGQDYARSRPEFPIHVGASHVYAPELKPLLNPDFVEGTEGIRSFLVSIIAAIWLSRRWWKRRELLSQEHRLDRYIRDVLKIERDQIGIDGDQPTDSDALQELLDRVTELRQAALSEFTAHELNEDQAVNCFVEMCHALSDKISGKLTRHSIRHMVGSPPAQTPHSRDKTDAS